uniref:TM2 domain-containing protein n=1 Tax=Steinernema glaseri TaxID=37863 RepID=A0A1I7ZML3_9BILA
MEANGDKELLKAPVREAIFPSPIQASPFFSPLLRHRISMCSARILPVSFLLLLLLSFLPLVSPESAPNDSKPNTVVVSTVLASSSPTNPPIVDDECSREMNDSFPKGPLIPCNFLDLRWVECEEPKLADASSNSSSKVDVSDVPPSGHALREGAPDERHLHGASLHRVPREALLPPRSPLHQVHRALLPLDAPLLHVPGHPRRRPILSRLQCRRRREADDAGRTWTLLMTLGGLGLWWIVDIFLLVNGNLRPADDSSWEPYY